MQVPMYSHMILLLFFLFCFFENRKICKELYEYKCLFHFFIDFYQKHISLPLNESIQRDTSACETSIDAASVKWSINVFDFK
jgi:hypothetical protein